MDLSANETGQRRGRKLAQRNGWHWRAAALDRTRGGETGRLVLDRDTKS